jgi:putative endonuclease
MKVYIIHSNKLDKYYVGSTQDIEVRLYKHNTGASKFTKSGSPWRLITTIDCENRSEAIKLEMKIKKRGIKRYLEDKKSG